MLTWEQLREIQEGGIECGAHSHTHPQLDSLSTPAAQDEIRRSKSILEEQLGPVNSFAYPFGYYSPRIRKLVDAAGYSSACAVKYGFSSTGDDPLALPRLVVPAAADIVLMNKLLNGGLAASQAYQRARFFSWQVIRQGAFYLKTRAFGSDN
jgi:peptidoglycan/xylan/chitin deacetylase (PgdA/CDA1 family)